MVTRKKTLLLTLLLILDSGKYFCEHFGFREIGNREIENWEIENRENTHRK